MSERNRQDDRDGIMAANTKGNRERDEQERRGPKTFSYVNRDGRRQDLNLSPGDE